MKKIIKIKRATTEGLKDAKGELIEYDGLQFCFTKIPDGLYFLIELSSGGNAATVDSERYSKRFALKLIMHELSKKSKREIEKAISEFVKINKKQYGISFPVNAPVDNCNI